MNSLGVNRNVYLSIILTLYGRWDYTLKFFDAITALREKPIVIIVYGEVDRSSILEARDTGIFDTIDAKLIYDDSPEGSLGNYLTKVKKALEHVDTPYVLLSDNDDKWDFNVLGECVSRASVVAHCAGVRPRVCELTEQPGFVAPWSEKLSSRRILRGGARLDGPDSASRIIQYIDGLNRYDSWLAYYSVFKAETFIKCWTRVLNNKSHDFVSFEMAFMFYILNEGPIYQIDKVGYYRLLHENTSSNLFRGSIPLVEHLVVNDTIGKLNLALAEILPQGEIHQVQRSFTALLTDWIGSFFLQKNFPVLCYFYRGSLSIIYKIRNIF
jgi:hypothetical protein